MHCMRKGTDNRQQRKPFEEKNEKNFQSQRPEGQLRFGRQNADGLRLHEMP